MTTNVIHSKWKKKSYYRVIEAEQIKFKKFKNFQIFVFRYKSTKRKNMINQKQLKNMIITDTNKVLFLKN